MAPSFSGKTMLCLRCTAMAWCSLLQMSGSCCVINKCAVPEWKSRSSSKYKVGYYADVLQLETQTPAPSSLTVVPLASNSTTSALNSGAASSSSGNSASSLGENSDEDHIILSADRLRELELLLDGEHNTLIQEKLQKERQVLIDALKQQKLPKPSFGRSGSRHVTRNPSPPTEPSKPKFKSHSTPNSTSSSPQFGSSRLKKKNRYQSHVDIFRPDSAASSSPSSWKLSYLQRSKSCGEARASAPSDKFDFISSAENLAETESFVKSIRNGNFDAVNVNLKSNKKSIIHKCGSCLYLPTFGKAKPVRPRKHEEEMEHVNSRRVSLEKFECGSWASSGLVKISSEDPDDSKNFFDLPLELIRGNINDAVLPVTTVFVFDRDPKVILKGGSIRSSGRKSLDSSSHHVRFSMSSPSSPTSCITSRLQRARDDFNTFLEAQSA